MYTLPDKKTKFLLTLMVFITLLMIALCVALFIVIKNKNIKNAQAVSDTEADFAYFYTMSDQKKKIKATTELRNKLEESIVTESNASQLFELLDTYANQASVTLDITTVSVDTTLHIELKTEGDFNSVYYFFSLLESLPVHMVVERVSFGYNTEISQEQTSIDEESGPAVESVQGVWVGRFTLDIQSFMLE